MVDIVIKSTVKDTDTLTTDTAVIVDSTMQDFEAAILLLKAKSELNIDWPNVTTDLVIYGLAYGDATIAQIASVFSSAVANPENAQSYRESQTATRAVIDYVALMPPETAGQVTAQSVLWDLPKGGLPAGKGSGFVTFVYNPSLTAAFTNGPIVTSSNKWIFGRL